MPRIFSLIVLSIFIVTFQLSPVFAKRLALVIGNNAYSNLVANQQLERARNDADSVGQTLASIGFKVSVGYDLNRIQMLEKISEFASQIERGDEVVFFYAGHGVEIEGQNFLLPSNIPKTNKTYILKSQAINFKVGIHDTFVDRGARISLFVLDACRNNPFKNEKGRSLGGSRGLAKIEKPAFGTMVLFSAAAGQVALDSLSNVPDNHRNSVFTRTLVPQLKKPGLEIKSLANVVRKKTYALARKDNHTQIPASYNEILNDYYLAGRSIKVEPSTSAKDNSELIALKKRLAALEKQRRNDSASKDRAKIAALEKRLAALQKLKNPQNKPPIQKTGGIFPLKHGYKFQDCKDCPKMIVIKGGTFTMGSSTREYKRFNDEGPQRRVRIKKFAVGQFEVTFDEWDACVRDGGCGGYRPKDEGWGRGNRPVINVSWKDAKAYTKWLSRKTGKTYRLLTEAEWEYVARAGTTTPFWWGSSASTDRANYDGNYTYKGSKGVYRKRTVPVDSFRPNPWGLYNVHGNVYEWVEDEYHKSYKSAPTDGSAWITSSNNEVVSRVVRGGSWLYDPQNLRSAVRNVSIPTFRSFDFGFRLSRTLLSEQTR